MDVVRPEVASAAVKPAAAEAEVARGGPAFDDVLSRVDGSQIKLHPPEAVVPGLQTDAVPRAEALRAEKLEQAKEPGGIERLGGELERSTARLREIISQLHGGDSYSPQQLLAMQAEMNDITLQIEVTTKVVAESVAGVRHLLQQQA